MTTDETQQHDTDAARKDQGVPNEGPGSKTAPPSNPETEAGETDKGKEKLGRIVNW
jgi:hypothetical protein